MQCSSPGSGSSREARHEPDDGGEDGQAQYAEHDESTDHCGAVRAVVRVEAAAIAGDRPLQVLVRGQRGELRQDALEARNGGGPRLGGPLGEVGQALDGGFQQVRLQGGQEALAQQPGLGIGLAAAQQELELVEGRPLQAGIFGPPGGQAAVLADEVLELGPAAAAALALRVGRAAQGAPAGDTSAASTKPSARGRQLKPPATPYTSSS